MLVPGRVLPGLGRPFPCPVRRVLIIGQKHSPGRAGDDLVPVEGNGVIGTEGPGLLSLIGSPQGFRRILDDHGPMAFADSPQLIDFSRRPV